MINREYREATEADLTLRARVFCYYVGPTPSAATLGEVASIPDHEGWVTVRTDDGKTHDFNAERLAVLR
jgi:hypothetical protein